MPKKTKPAPVAAATAATAPELIATLVRIADALEAIAHSVSEFGAMPMSLGAIEETLCETGSNERPGEALKALRGIADAIAS